MQEPAAAPPSATSRRPAAEILAGSVLFKRFDLEEIRVLLADCEEVDLAPGADLIKEGDEADAVYFLIEGEVDVLCRSETGPLLTVARQEAVKTIGEMGLFDPAPRSATVRAVGPCRAVRLPFERLHEVTSLLGASARLRGRMVGELTRKFRETTESATQLLGAKLEEAKARITLGRFVVRLLSIAAVYMFAMSEVTNRVGFGSSYSAILIALLILLGVSVAFFIKQSPYPRALFGLTLEGWRKTTLQALVLTVPILLVLVAAKATLIATVPKFASVRLFDFGAPFRSNLVAFAIVEGFYTLFTPVQELIVRSGLQRPFELFLEGPRRHWTAILISNFVFSATHLHFGLLFAAAVFPVGVYWGWMFHRQGSLLGVCISHLVVGNFVFAVLGVEGLLS